MEFEKTVFQSSSHTSGEPSLWPVGQLQLSYPTSFCWPKANSENVHVIEYGPGTDPDLTVAHHNIIEYVAHYTRCCSTLLSHLIIQTLYGTNSFSPQGNMKQRSTFMASHQK